LNDFADKWASNARCDPHFPQESIAHRSVSAFERLREFHDDLSAIDEVGRMKDPDIAAVA